MYTRWLLFLHIASVLALLGTHGTSMTVLYRIRRERDVPASSGPSPIGSAILVEIRTSARRPVIASPSTLSEAPFE